jgi:hypothetical protein
MGSKNVLLRTLVAASSAKTRVLACPVLYRSGAPEERGRPVQLTSIKSKQLRLPAERVIPSKRTTPLARNFRWVGAPQALSSYFLPPPSAAKALPWETLGGYCFPVWLRRDRAGDLAASAPGSLTRWWETGPSSQTDPRKLYESSRAFWRLAATLRAGRRKTPQRTPPARFEASSRPRLRPYFRQAKAFGCRRRASDCRRWSNGPARSRRFVLHRFAACTRVFRAKLACGPYCRVRPDHGERPSRDRAG